MTRTAVHWCLAALLLAAATAAHAAWVLSEFPVPAVDSRPFNLAVAADESVWFTDPGADAIGHVNTSGNVQLVLAGSVGGPTGLAVAIDGTIWFAENDRNRITRINPDPPYDPLHFDIPTAAALPMGVAVALDGQVWFTESGANRIGRLAGDQITEFELPNANSAPLNIVAGSDGWMYFTEHSGNRVSRIRADGTIEELADLGPGSRPFGIALAGALWITESSAVANRLVRVIPDQEYAEYNLPTPASMPAMITCCDSQQALWFTELGANQVGRSTAAGDIEEIGLPAGSLESGTLFGGGIAVGPGDSVWVAFNGNGKIGRLQPATPTATATAIPQATSTTTVTATPVATASTTMTPTGTLHPASPTPTPSLSVPSTQTAIPTATRGQPSVTATESPSPTWTPVEPAVPSDSSSGGGCATTNSAGSHYWPPHGLAVAAILALRRFRH